MEFVASKQWLQLSSATSTVEGVQPLDFTSLLTADSSSSTFESDSFKYGFVLAHFCSLVFEFLFLGEFF